MSGTAKTISPKRALTRQKLIDAAAQAIAAKGFSATTLDEIAARAGLTKGAIYDNFASKDELFFAVIEANPAALPMPEGRAGSTAERMAAMAKGTLESPDTQVQIPLRAEFLLYTLVHPEMHERVDRWLKDGFAYEQARLLAAFDEAELPMSTKAFVVMLEAMIPGLNYLRSQSPDLVTPEVVAEIFAALAHRA